MTEPNSVMRKSLTPEHEKALIGYAHLRRDQCLSAKQSTYFRHTSCLSRKGRECVAGFISLNPVVILQIRAIIRGRKRSRLPAGRIYMADL